MAYDLTRDAKNRVDDARARERILSNQLSQLELDYQQRSVTISQSASSQKSRVQSDLTTVTNNVRLMQRDISSLQEKQTKLQEKMKTLQSELGKLQDTQTSIQNKLIEAQKHQADYNNKLISLQTEQQRAERALEISLKSKIENVRSELRRLTNNIPALESAYAVALTKQSQQTVANDNTRSGATRGYGNLR